MTNYHDEVVQDQRLRILQLLKDAPNYSYNEQILSEKLGQQFGHWMSVDRLATETTWLSEQKLVMLRPVSTMVVVSLTLRGLDVARDRAHVPGIARPGPCE